MCVNMSVNMFVDMRKHEYLDILRVACTKSLLPMHQVHTPSFFMSLCLDPSTSSGVVLGCSLSLAAFVLDII